MLANTLPPAATVLQILSIPIVNARSILWRPPIFDPLKLLTPLARPIFLTQSLREQQGALYLRRSGKSALIRQSSLGLPLQNPLLRAITTFWQVQL